MSESLTVLGTWRFDPPLAIGIVAVAAAYLFAAHRVSVQHPAAPWPRRYTVSFVAALALTWIVTLGPIGAYDDTFFWAHMLQHIALTVLVAPLLLLGAPMLLVLRASSRGQRHAVWMPLLRSHVVVWLTNPYAGWLLFAGVLMGTHFSPFYEFALEHPVVHQYVEHPLYLGVALIYYYPLLAGNPGPRRVPYAGRALSLFTMMFPETMTGFFIYSSRYLMYPFYAHVDRPFGGSALSDQQLGGALMWAGSMLIDSVWVVVAVAAWLRSERAVAERIDLETMRDLTVASGSVL